MNRNFEVLQDDLRHATVKEITDCMKAVNATLGNQARMILTGRKDEIIMRFASFIVSLIANNKKSIVASVIRIVNETAPRKLSWKYENDQIIVNCSKSRPRNGPVRERTLQVEQMDFKYSPFLKPLIRLTSIKICPVAVNNNRQSRLFQFTLNEESRRLLTTPNAVDDRPPYQIRFYCSQYTGDTSKLLMEMPTVCELKVNDNVIQGSILRCIKGRPGTVNPPDLTIMTRKQAMNNVELVYINNEVPYIASIYLVERTPVARLIQIMKETRVLTKEAVMEKLQQTQEDADIVMECETLSTKDPLAFTRIITPIRSKQCQHLQCFDAQVYLTMNEQTPSWSCPVCYRRIDDWEDLLVDEYFTEMLHSTPKHIDSVRVEANGHITIIDENPELAQESEEEEEAPVKEEEVTTILLDDDDDDDHDDVVEQVQPNTTTAITTNITTASSEDVSSETVVALEESSQNIPNTSPTTTTIDANATAPATTSTSNADAQEPPKKKQKTADVIDLTLDSDDEPEEIAPPGPAVTSVPFTTETSDETVPNSQDSAAIDLDDARNQLIMPHPETLYNKDGTPTKPNNRVSGSSAAPMINVYKYN